MSNLHYIDPEDQEILQELREVRLALIRAIEKCPNTSRVSDLEIVNEALVRSSLEAANEPEEEQKKHAARRTKCKWLRTPGAINAALVAATLFEPGTSELANPSRSFRHGSQLPANIC